MIKGAQKQMIVVRTGGSRYFDEAYFVLRKDVKPARGEQSDMLSEADRILKESETVRPVKKPHRAKPYFLFALGILLGAAAAVLIFLLVV